jgi:hypothetical protein
LEKGVKRKVKREVGSIRLSGIFSSIRLIFFGCHPVVELFKATMLKKVAEQIVGLRKGRTDMTCKKWIWGKGEEMTQTLCAYVSKRKKEKWIAYSRRGQNIWMQYEINRKNNEKH